MDAMALRTSDGHPRRRHARRAAECRRSSSSPSHGYSAPSHQIIAGRAGTAPVALVDCHLGSKEMLLEAVLEHRASRLNRRSIATVPGRPTPARSSWTVAGVCARGGGRSWSSTSRATRSVGTMSCPHASPGWQAQAHGEAGTSATSERPTAISRSRSPTPCRMRRATTSRRLSGTDARSSRRYALSLRQDGGIAGRAAIVTTTSSARCDSSKPSPRPFRCSPRPNRHRRSA